MEELIGKVMTIGEITEFMAEVGYKVHEYGMESPFITLCDTSSELDLFQYISYTDGDGTIDVYFEPVGRDFIGKPYESWLVSVEEVNTNDRKEEA